MKSIKKAIALLLSFLLIMAFTNFSLARSSNITAIDGNDTSASNDANTSNDTSDNSTNEASSNNTSDNSTSNNSSSNTSLNNSSINSTRNTSSANTSKPISTTNSTENLPNTGIDSTYFNFALILLLAVVLGMFSLVQYNKLVKKDKE